MTLPAARVILGLGPDEDPRPYLREFRVVRERLAEINGNRASRPCPPFPHRQNHAFAWEFRELNLLAFGSKIEVV